MLAKIAAGQAANIAAAGGIVARALEQGGVVHAFGTGHSHMIAEEAFFRAGGLPGVNPILDSRLIFLEGALESTAAERDPGTARRLIEKEDVRPSDAAIVISNSGRNAAPVEMALEMKARGVKTIAITNIRQSQAAPARHASGKRLFEIVDVAVDTCAPPGDAMMQIPGVTYPMGASSTVAGSAIVQSIFLEAAAELVRGGRPVRNLPSANSVGVDPGDLEEILRPYAARVRYLRGK